jgi:GNAT superfamily N-acetyltransferase
MRNCAPGPQLELDDISPSSPELLRLLATDDVSTATVCIIARVNGRAVGAAAMRETAAGTAAVVELAVAGPWRGTGIERHLTEALQDRARVRGWALAADDTQS